MKLNLWVCSRICPIQRDHFYIWSRRADCGSNRNNPFSTRQIRERNQYGLVSRFQNAIGTFVLPFFTLVSEWLFLRSTRETRGTRCCTWTGWRRSAGTRWAWTIFFLFLQTKPSFSPLFTWSQLDISATSDSVSAVSEGYQLHYCWIVKLLSGPRICFLICVVTSLSVYPSCLCLCSFCIWGKIF
jgi:hypothetical protein